MTLETVMAYLKDIDMRFNDRLDKLTVVEAAKGPYTTAEFAELVGKAKFTVREWCRLGRINAMKCEGAKRGDAEEWHVTHDELLRYQAHKLLPHDRNRNSSY